MNKHTAAIYEILMDKAPTQDARDKIEKSVKKFCNSSVEDNNLRTITSWLYYGLTYGNWPWIIDK